MKIFALGISMIMFGSQAQASHGDGNVHCTHALAAHIKCVAGVTDDANWSSSVTVLAINPPGMPWQGNTIASVSAAFPTVVEWAWRTNSAANLNAKMASIPDLELARLSHLYWLDTHGNMTPLLMMASQKLTAANLVKFRAAFGVATDAEVVTYAPAAVRSAYLASAKRVSIHQSHAAYTASGKVSRTINAMPLGVAAPNIWMTPYEIYEEYLWTGTMTADEAAFAAAKFMGGPVFKAATWGYSVGSAFYAFAEKIDPWYGFDIMTTYGDSAAADFGYIDNVVGTSYIDGPIVEIPLGSLGDMSDFQYSIR